MTTAPTTPGGDRPGIDVARIRSLGLYMADEQDGASRLDVDDVRSCGVGTELQCRSIVSADAPYFRQ
jgi:hypothetical protein